MTQLTTNKALIDAFLVPIISAKHLREWMLTFIGIDFPMGHVFPGSNSSPVEWMYEAYCTYRDNKGNENPGYIVLSSRDSYKTLSESAFSVLLMCHFGATIAHLAAIESQSSKAVQYISSFVKKVEPYLHAHKRDIDAQSKRKIQIKSNDGSVAYVNVIIATVQGANSEHTNVLSIDEIDVMRFPKAFEEAKMIPGVMNGQFPLVIKTSTRKYAFGLMQQEMNNIEQSGDKVLQWNLIDVTERCPETRHKPELPKVKRYIHDDLPLRNISPETYAEMTNESRKGYFEIEAHSGCGSCKLLPVCQTRLASRPKEDVGGLYKPIDFTINQFGKVSPETGEAQLLCRKPSTAGLLYGRFDENPETGNVYTVDQAWERFTGDKMPQDGSFEKLVQLMVSKGVAFYAGIDWGHVHFFSIVVSCLVGGDWWIMETIAVNGLEFDEILTISMEVRDRYKIRKWHADTAEPMFIKTFRKNKMPCQEFTKDVKGGIECVRGQITDAKGKRRMKVILHDQNKLFIDMVRQHHFKLDPAGNPTQEPDDDEFADIGDATRYSAQCLFGNKRKVSTGDVKPTPDNPQRNPEDKFHQDWIALKARELAGIQGSGLVKSKSGGVIVDFGDE